MAEAILQVQSRTEKGKQAAKHLRKEGLVPGILFGPGEQPSMLSINLKKFLNLLHMYGRNVVVDLAVGDRKRKIKAFIYEIQHDPISGDIIHVDLKHISLKEKITVTIPIHLSGISTGVKNEGGILEHLMHTVEISCLPTEIPESTGGTIHVRELPHEKFEIINDPENVVVHVVAPKVHVVEEKPEEAVPVEPEVIGGKKEEE
jgi:large subunit ribosomal protein L25